MREHTIVTVLTVSANAWDSLEARIAIAGASGQTHTYLDGQPMPELSKSEDLGTTPIGRLQLGETSPGAATRWRSTTSA